MSELSEILHDFHSPPKHTHKQTQAYKDPIQANSPFLAPRLLGVEEYSTCVTYTVAVAYKT